MREIELKPCDNPLCDYMVTVGTAYCCHLCSMAHDGGYEIHESGPLGHAPECLRRDADSFTRPFPGDEETP